MYNEIKRKNCNVFGYIMHDEISVSCIDCKNVLASATDSKKQTCRIKINTEHYNVSAKQFIEEYNRLKKVES